MYSVGQRSLDNFYRSVLFDNPSLASDIYADVFDVSLGGMSEDKSFGKDAAERLRRVAFDLPVIQAKVLDSALSELGY